MAFKVLITDGLSKDGLKILEADKNLQLDVRDKTDAQELLRIIPEYDCVVVRSATQITKEVIERASQLKLVCRAGAGVDNVDVEAATAKNIKVMNTASANSLAAAEHAIALMFALLRHVPQAQQSMKEGRWDRANYAGWEMTGKTVAVLGLGNIGRLVAERCLGLSMQVVGYDPMVNENTLAASLKGRVRLVSSLEEALAAGDIVTLHLPLVKATKGLLNGEKLLKMKKGSWLINCARGKIVDENAVAELLDSGHLRGAAFDVFENEPVVNPSKLVQHPKAVVTPHLGASTAEAQTRVGTTAAQQMIGFFARNDMSGVLN